MIASAAIITAMMMTIPMLMAASSDHPLATISPRLALRRLGSANGHSSSER
jgi:hypothetical protein